MTDFAIQLMLVGSFVTCGVMAVACVAWLVEAHRADRRRATLPPDSTQLRELAASLERLSRRVTDLANRSETAEKEEHAGAA
jgi:outer membrane murein-binding lipoprotein Lpp